MKTIRNLATAALLTLAAVVINQQSAYAYDPANACQGYYGTSNPQQQCAIVPGGYPAISEPDACVWSSYAEGPVLQSTFVCRKDAPPSEWGGGVCFNYYPSGNPMYCG